MGKRASQTFTSKSEAFDTMEDWMRRLKAIDPSADIDMTVIRGSPGSSSTTVRMQSISTSKPTATEQLEAERDEARGQVRTLQLQLTLERDRVTSLREQLRQADARAKSLREQIAAGVASIDATFIGKLIQLCHPDRHKAGLGALANEVTAKLLTMRKGAS